MARRNSTSLRRGSTASPRPAKKKPPAPNPKPLTPKAPRTPVRALHRRRASSAAAASPPQPTPSPKRKSQETTTLPQPPAKRPRSSYCDEFMGRGDAYTTKKTCEDELAPALALAGQDGPIAIARDTQLDFSEMALAILSVTEAISQGGAVKFCLYDVEAAAVAAQAKGRWATVGGMAVDFFATHRDGRPLLMPWVAGAWDSAHDRLVWARPAADGAVEVTFYDSMVAPGDRARRVIETQVQEHLGRSTWMAGARGYRFAWKDSRTGGCVEQVGATCGLHVVLNAWIVALGFEPSQKNRRRGSQNGVHYQHIADVVRLAIHGAATFDYIFAALVCLGYIDEGETVEEGRRFEWTAGMHSDSNAQEMLEYSRRRSQTMQKKDKDSGGQNSGAGANTGEPTVTEPPKTPETPQRSSPKSAPSAANGSPDEGKENPHTYLKQKILEHEHVVGTEEETGSSSFLISPKEDLLDTDIVLALLSVTEAVSQLGVAKFCLYEPLPWAEIQNSIMRHGIQNWKAHNREHGMATEFDIHRREKAILMPWGLYRAKQPTKAASDIQDPATTETSVHQVLVLATHETVGSSARIHVRIYDSAPGHAMPRRQEIQDQIRELLGTSWCDWPRDSWRFEWPLVMLQTAPTACGIHATLNGWTLALGLQPPGIQLKVHNPDGELEFYRAAAAMIGFAGRGMVRADTIMALFRSYGFVQNRTREVSGRRRFNHTVTIMDVSEHRRLSGEKAKKGQPTGIGGDKNKSNTTPSRPPANNPPITSPTTPTSIDLDASPPCSTCPVPGHCVTPAADTTNPPRSSYALSVSQPWADKTLKGGKYSPSDSGDRLKKWIGKKKQLAKKSRYFEPQAVAWVSSSRQLSDGQIIRGIECVTEAIGLHSEGGAEFGVYTKRAYESALKGGGEKEDIVVGTRQEVLLPLVTGRGKKANRDTCDIVLLRVRHGVDGRSMEDRIVVEYWTDLLDTLTDEDKDFLQHDAENLIRRLRWWSGPGEDDEDEPPFKHHWHASRRRSSKFVGGIHVILDAWALALGLTPMTQESTTPTSPQAFAAHTTWLHKGTIELITMAVHGCMNAELIIAQLRSFGWVQSTAQLDEARNFKSTCAFSDEQVLQDHVSELFSQIYPDGAQRRDKPTCLGCPVQNHCPKKPGSKDGEERKWRPAFWPDILRDYPCPFFNGRLQTLEQYQVDDDMAAEWNTIVQDFGTEKDWTLSAVVRAIASITEAISMNGYGGQVSHGQKVLFALYDHRRFNDARREGVSGTDIQPLRFKAVDGKNDLGRYGEQIIVPFANNHLVSASTRATKRYHSACGLRPEIVHYFLEDPAFPGMPIGSHKADMEKDVESTLRNMRWFKGGFDTPAAREEREYFHTWRPVAPLLPLLELNGEQGSERTALLCRTYTGLHMILNAWVIALGFQPPTAGLRFTSYGDLWRLVVLACQGIIDSATIFALLRCVNWIQGEDVDLPEARRFDETPKFVVDDDLTCHYDWVKERLDVLERWKGWKPKKKDLDAKRELDAKKAEYEAKQDTADRKHEEAKRREADSPDADGTRAAREQADDAGTGASLARCVYEEAADRYRGPTKDLHVTHRELLRTPGCGPAFRGVVPSLIAEEMRIGYWDGLDGQLEAIRRSEAEKKLEKASKLLASVLGKRKREMRQLEVNSKSEVYGELLRQHTREGLQRVIPPFVFLGFFFLSV